MELKDFLEKWLPKTDEWKNVANFILESGVNFSTEVNGKWLPGYTNISISNKPHHYSSFIRYMEEQMFMLHDVIHQLFTISINCSEEEYVKRQMYGELFVFYLTELVIPFSWDWESKEYKYIDKRRDTKSLLLSVLLEQPSVNVNIIDWMWSVFIEDTELIFLDRLDRVHLEKYRKMFKEDLENSRKNYKFVKNLNLQDYCIVGASSENHIDFFEAVKKGEVKNIKREFNLKLPDGWN